MGLAGDLSETVEARRQWNDIITKTQQNCQTRILNLVKLPFKYEGEIKVFSFKERLKGMLLADLP